FADTAENRLELTRLEFGDPLPVSQYDEALRFAGECIELRHETPRALEIAEEIYHRTAVAMKEDSLPRLGLARVYEAGFQFEKALEQYQSMLAGAWGRNPLVLTQLAELEARFRLFRRAEERLAEAERYGRTFWQVQWALGRFLYQRQ